MEIFPSGDVCAFLRLDTWIPVQDQHRDTLASRTKLPVIKTLFLIKIYKEIYTNICTVCV